jgi:CheY-like chemotaxis protein
MSQTHPTHGSLKILLVENSRTGRAILLRQLQEHGYSADAVGSGKEAMESILKTNYNLIIMDIFLPEMNGYEVAQHIKAIQGPQANIVIVALTSSTDEIDKKKCLDAGMNEYVIKSDDNIELISVLQKYQSSPPSLENNDQSTNLRI